MGTLWIFLIIALIRFMYERSSKKSSGRVSVDELKRRFSTYTTLSELIAEYSRLLVLNEANPEATRIIEEVYLAAKAKLKNKEESQRSKKDAKFKSAREKNEKIFSNISTLEELKKKYRKLSQANHPDHGGNLTAMKRLNELYEQAFERISLKR